MNRICVFIFLLSLAVALQANAQARKRTAILRSGGNFPQAEQTIADQLVTRLVEGGNIEVVDRAKLAQILTEQNMQNYTGRFSQESAVHIGKLLGVPAIIFVRVDAWSGGQRTVNNGNKHTIYGNVVLKTTAQIINVETGSIFAAPTASFEQERVLSESTDARRGFSLGPIPIPPGKATQGPDPQAALGKLTNDAFDSVERELSSKIATTLVAAPIQPAVPQRIPKVAGVQDGMTFVNAGANLGLRVGQTFQIIRMVDSGMQDPDTHQPILRKKQVCVLTISEVEDSLASGKCAGDLAQNGDQAIATPSH